MSQLSKEQQAKIKQRAFGQTFMGAVGTIEGGDGTPVTINVISHSLFCVASRAAEFGCPPGEEAILVEWLPAGLMLDKDGPDQESFPKETGTDPSQIPDPSTWVVFPKLFDDVPVYYKRGAAIWAL